MDSSNNKGQPSLPSKFVTLADLKERWLKQKEFERKETELQEQRQQRGTKQIQQHHEVQSQPLHRGHPSEFRPNGNRFGSRRTDKKRESRPVGSLTSGDDKNERSEVGTGVGSENVKLTEKGKEKKTDKKPKVGRRGEQYKESPKSVENEVVNEYTEQAPLGKKREMKFKEEKGEDIEDSGRIGNERSTNELEEGNKNFLTKIDKKFGQVSVEDRRNVIFTRSRHGFNNSFRDHSDRRVAEKHLNKRMVWVRKDGVASGRSAIEHA